MQPKRVDLTKWLTEILDSTGWSQTNLADRLSQYLGQRIDRSMVNKMVLGKRSISAYEMLAIADISKAPLPGQPTQQQHDAILDAYSKLSPDAQAFVRTLATQILVSGPD